MCTACSGAASAWLGRAVHLAMGKKSPSRGGPPEAPLWGTTRLKTVLLLSVCNVICYADRVNIGVAIIPMTQELTMSKTTETLVLSSFFWGYLVTQTLAGPLCRMYNAANVLIGAVLVWSLMTVSSARPISNPLWCVANNVRVLTSVACYRSSHLRPRTTQRRCLWQPEWSWGWEKGYPSQ